MDNTANLVDGQGKNVLYEIQRILLKILPRYSLRQFRCVIGGSIAENGELWHGGAGPFETLKKEVRHKKALS